MKTIQQYLNSKKYSTISDSTVGNISKWLEWYQGEVESFHKYTVYNGINTTQCQRLTLGMAKKICEDWANLILNEKVSINAGNYDERLNGILEKNNFRVRGNRLVEISYALGTGAFVEYLDGNGEVIIDYIRADMIHPISWDNGDVTECAFGTYRTQGDKEVIYLQIHRYGRVENGENPDEYYIENNLVDAKTGKELEMDDVESIVRTYSQCPLFQIITPNIQNNIDLDSPLGISVYGNSISQLKACDVIFDSYVNEFILGKKRIIVPSSAAKIQLTKDGVQAPVFDPNDTVYYAMPGDRNIDLGLTENNMTIRAADHEMGIQRALDLLSLKCGMGTGRYQFNSSGVKTATEVISDKSDLYQNLKKNELVIKTAIVGMVRAVAFLDGAGEVDCTVDFDDSIIEDSNTTIDKNIKLVQSGLKSKISSIMEINKCSKEEAQEELERIAEEGQIRADAVDWTAADQGNQDGNQDAVEEEDVEGEGENEGDVD